MLISIVYLLWILFAIYEGKREAFYFSCKIKTTQTFIINEHVMFTIQRIFVVSMAILACHVDWLNCILILFSLALCFPFFHDGMYYITRHKLDGIYVKGWFDQSTTSTANSDKLHLFDPLPRTILLGLSLGLIIYEIIKFWKWA